MHPTVKRYKAGTLEKDVRGDLILEVKKNKNWIFSVDIEFDKLASELLLTEDYARQVVFDVKVKEADTGRIENNTAVYTMFKYRHKLQLIKTAEAFKPGIPYVAYLKVNKQVHKFR